MKNTYIKDGYAMQRQILNPGETPSLKQQVYEILRVRIINGDLAPGEKLHEKTLSTELGISRAPLREALNMLDRDGFAKITPRHGAVVTDIAPEDIQMLWDVRELLEPSAAVMSMENIPKDQLTLIRQNLEHVLEQPEDFTAYIESDIAVHALLSDYLTNRYLSDILKNLKNHSLRMRWNAEKQSDENGLEIVQASTKEHIEIIDAFLLRDQQALYQAVLRHIQVSRTRTMKRFISGKSEDGGGSL